MHILCIVKKFSTNLIKVGQCTVPSRFLAAEELHQIKVGLMK
jgi:hypothetical protein